MLGKGVPDCKCGIIWEPDHLATWDTGLSFKMNFISCARASRLEYLASKTLTWSAI